MSAIPISIIVPVYNVEPYLRQCLDSILGQTFTNFEVLLVNDGSADSSGDICREYVEKDSRFHYFEKENGGLSDARNYGIERAQGEYLTFIDSDDFVNEKHLENLFLASRLSNADITIGGFSRFENGTFWLYQDYFSSDSLVSFTSAQAIQHLDSMFDVPFLNFSIVCGKLFKRDLFKELRFQYGKYAEDQFIIWKLYLKASSIYTFNVDSYVYRINKTGMSSVFSLKHLDYIDALEERIKFTKDIDGIDIGLSFNMYRYVLKRTLDQLEEHQFLDEASQIRRKLELAEREEYPFLFDESHSDMGGPKELISIIVPIYNSGRYLRQCLDSIINQSYKNFEVLLINDGSVDDSATICKEYVEKDSRIRYFEKENGGVSSARNLGLKNVKGNYITFVDSDDWVDENYLELLYYNIKQKNADIAVATYKVFGEDGVFYIKPPFSKEEDEMLDFEELPRKDFLKIYPKLIQLVQDFHCVGFKLFKVDLVDNLFFDESLKYAEDMDFFYRLYLRMNSIVYMREYVYIYRKNDTSITQNMDETCVLQDLKVHHNILKQAIKHGVSIYFYVEYLRYLIELKLKQFPNSHMLKSFESSILETLDTVTYSQPLISIIVPIYNVEKYLRMCLDSIEHQTYSNIEVLLINDGSPDSSGEICQEYVARDSRFRYFEKENGGLSDARNYGIERSNGKYITFVDSDDWVEQTYIEDLYNAALNNDSEIVVSNYKRFDVKENHYLIHVWDDYYEENYEGKELINQLPLLERRDFSFTTSWGILFSRSLFDNIKFPKGKLTEDSRTNYKLFAKSSRSTYINKCLYMYRIGREESIINTVTEKLLIDKLECVLERLAIYTIKGWNSFDEKENTLGYIRQGWEAAKEAGLQDTEIFRRYTEILNLIDNN
ncbi:glycosyltransferase [Streptococcus mitis]|uniref:glycosyltransferase family 2 protein n=1 Tax=Streptococcus mitis TaxID=28037 RepID=UPI0021B74B2C